MKNEENQNQLSHLFDNQEKYDCLNNLLKQIKENDKVIIGIDEEEIYDNLKDISNIEIKTYKGTFNEISEELKLNNVYTKIVLFIRSNANTNLEDVYKICSLFDKDNTNIDLLFSVGFNETISDFVFEIFSLLGK